MIKKLKFWFLKQNMFYTDTNYFTGRILQMIYRDDKVILLQVVHKSWGLEPD